MENKAMKAHPNHVALLGACMSDLVACVHALVTEGEEGDLLAVRMRELEATTGAILRHARQIAAKRDESTGSSEKV